MVSPLIDAQGAGLVARPEGALAQTRLEASWRASDVSFVKHTVVYVIAELSAGACGVDGAYPRPAVVHVACLNESTLG